MMGRRHHRTVNRWGMPDDHIIAATRCNCCGSTEPVAWYAGSIPVCARCYDMWMRSSRYRRPMTEGERYDRRMDAIADMAADECATAEREAY